MSRPAFLSARCIALALLLASSLSACQLPGNTPMNAEKTVELKVRPRPQQAYRIVMTIENAPGPFEQIVGSARYDVVNYQACGELSRIRGAEGVASRIETQPEVRMERLSDNTYAATVYADLMIDEDYYGRGTCHWKFSYFSALLRATGDERETRFLPSIDATEIFEKKAIRKYFWKKSYPMDSPLPSNGHGFPEFGQMNLDNVPDDRKSEFFSIVLAASDVRP
ncbi:MAG: hypothetical protein JF600_06565 [Xanthomonadales bacterium]|nr:hypothetical protein [Xanthomonadales bacterium]